MEAIICRVLLANLVKGRRVSGTAKCIYDSHYEVVGMMIITLGDSLDENLWS